MQDLFLPFLFLFLCIGLITWQIKKYFRGGIYIGNRANLEGCVAVVTGGNGGIGRELVKELAQQGCQVVIADIVDSQNIVEEINQKLGKQMVQYIKIDLGDLKSIQHFAHNLQHNKIDILINNAAVMGLPTLTHTKQNHQIHYGVNYLGHFYLTHLLWDKLNKSQHFRIVNMSSITHRKVMGFGRQTTFQENNFNFQKSQYDCNVAYARSKLYLTMFAKTLSEKIENGKGSAYAVHPGIVRSKITDHLTSGRARTILFNSISPFYWIFTKSCQEGIQTTLTVLYTDPKGLKSGAFYSDCAVTWANPLVQLHHRKLFELTEKSLGINFGQAIPNTQRQK